MHCLVSHRAPMALTLACGLLALSGRPSSADAGSIRVCTTIEPPSVAPGRPDPGGGLVVGEAVLLSDARWPKRVLTVSFMGGSPQLRARVQAAASQWTRYAGLTFDFAPVGPGDIRIAFRVGMGSWSVVGSGARRVAPDQPTMNFGWLDDDTADDEVRRVVLHEFGHAIGFLHEHQSPAGGIPWDRPAVYAYYRRTNGWDATQVDQQVFQLASASRTRFSAFDRSSIMLYAIPEELTIGAFSVPWNTTLSASDQEYAAIWYPRRSGAALSLPAKDRAYFFAGEHYYRFDFGQNRVDRVGRIGVDGWRGVWTDVDAAVMHPRNGKAYFFKGDRYQRFDFGPDRVDREGRIGVDGWRGVWTSGIDAAIAHPNGKVYFFKGDRYQRFDFTSDRVDREGRIGADGWRGVWTTGVDAAVSHPNGKGYFFVDGSYRRFDYTPDRVDREGRVGVDGWQGL